ncbi:MAG: ABC transporter permease [Anaerolineae bacterium]|nr:ABC transporter permease [Anaerolineae bacterium]MBN8618300.1 ABC transporter permease [Anaerolineae bacterium]
MAATSSGRKQAASTNQILDFIVRSWAYIFLLIMILFFSLTGRGFFTLANFSNVLVTSTMVALMAIGQTYVVITAGIDLSIGWTVGLASVISARIMRDMVNAGTDIGAAMVIAVILALAASIIPGFVNGVLIARVKVPPFIATLGMFGIVRGAAFLLTDGQQVVGGLPNQLQSVLRSIGSGSLLWYIPGQGITFLNRPTDLPPEISRGVAGLLPYPVIITAVVVLIFGFILGRMKFGRHTYAIGGNQDASIRAGINIRRHLIWIYVFSAFTAGIAGVLHTFRFTAGAPNAAEAALLQSVAAVVIGGTSLFGGEGKISGAVIGALIINVLSNGLVILNINPLWQFIVVGVVIIVAVLVNQAQTALERLRTNG